MKLGKINSLESLITGRPMWSDVDVEKNGLFTLKVSTIDGIIVIPSKAYTKIKANEELELVSLIDRVETHPNTNRQTHIREATVRAKGEQEDEIYEWK